MRTLEVHQLANVLRCILMLQRDYIFAPIPRVFYREYFHPPSAPPQNPKTPKPQNPIQSVSSFINKIMSEKSWNENGDDYGDESNPDDEVDIIEEEED